MLLPLVLSLALLDSTGVYGRVTDDGSGVPIAGARVAVVGGLAAVTDSAGAYRVDVGGGAWRMRVTRFGYEGQELEVIAGAAGGVRVDVALRAVPAPLAPVRVTARAPRPVADEVAPSLSPSSVGVRRFTADDLRANPTLAEADALLAFAAEHDVSVAPESPSSFHVRGGSSDQTRVLIDGLPVYNPSHSLGAFGAVNPDALEALELHAGALSAAFGRSLSGTLVARTRAPDSLRIGVRGGVSATSARLTIDGPLFSPRSTFLASGRSGSPSLFGGRVDDSRVASAFDDWLVKSSTRFASGTLTVLATETQDRSAMPGGLVEGALENDGRHHFDWGGVTTGATWAGRLGAASDLSASIWRAEFDADASWLGTRTLEMESARRTHGAEGVITMRHRRNVSRLGIDVLDDRASYGVRDASTGISIAPRALEGARQGSVALFAEHDAAVRERWRVTAGGRGTVFSPGGLKLEPRLAVRFLATPTIVLSAGAARTHQTVQSLRDPESMARSVFGADLPVLSSAGGGVGRSDEATVALDATLAGSLRLTVDGYARRLTGLVLPSAESESPFAVGGFSLGRGSAWGSGARLEMSGDRSTALLAAGIGGTTVRATSEVFESSASAAGYQPAHANTRTLTAAAGHRVGDRSWLRTALFARWGQRTTLHEGSLDWEGCDPFDGGCEMGGTPGRAVGEAGGVRLPAYLRWDIGARHMRTLRLGGRALTLEAHATLRNLLDRRNVWGYTESSDGEVRAVRLRPLSVLTMGIDFRY